MLDNKTFWIKMPPTKFLAMAKMKQSNDVTFAYFSCLIGSVSSINWKFWRLEKKQEGQQEKEKEEKRENLISL